MVAKRYTMAHVEPDGPSQLRLLTKSSTTNEALDPWPFGMEPGPVGRLFF